jgi:hypothetical protein
MLRISAGLVFRTASVPHRVPLQNDGRYFVATAAMSSSE